MNSYYQWSGLTREFRFRELKEALRTGEIPPPGPCEMCGQTHNTMYHNEAYGPTRQAHLDARYSMCGRCHAMLHMRFRFPGRWAEYKEKCRREGPQPTVRSMGEIYYGEVPRWGPDIPVVIYRAEGDAWWEKLSTARYRGPLAPEPTNHD